MRGKKASARVIAPDFKFQNVQLSKFINYVMKDGKKTTAQSVVYGALDIIKDKTAKEKAANPEAIEMSPIEVFETAIKNSMPSLEVKSKRVGGANYQVPIPVRGERRIYLAFNWIIGAARAKKGRDMDAKLADELMAAAKNEGDAVRKKMDVQKMAEANRAFAHFAK